MRLSDFVCVDAIVADLEAEDRDGVIRELAGALGRANALGSGKPDEIAKAVIKREKEASTGLGKGVAVPHVKTSAVQEAVAAIGCCGAGIDFSSLDKQPVYTVILLLSPIDNAEAHLQVMECVFRNLQKEDFRRFLRQAQTVEQIKETILEADVSEN
ncbi:MAG: PTS sugar transporter subunit IIA [Planctomycetes bacterium]|nr:PTS sugar transporter subunit IIA [Planctomycetota bacterium]